MTPSLKNIVNFTSTSFLRGITFNNSIVILDEAQNLESHETNTVMTRLGDNSKIIICGDFKQTDLVKKYEIAGVAAICIEDKTFPKQNSLLEDSNQDLISEKDASHPLFKNIIPMEI